jgi:hypothetical protein
MSHEDQRQPADGDGQASSQTTAAGSTEDRTDFWDDEDPPSGPRGGAETDRTAGNTHGDGEQGAGSSNSHESDPDDPDDPDGEGERDEDLDEEPKKSNTMRYAFWATIGVVVVLVVGGVLLLVSSANAPAKVSTAEHSRAEPKAQAGEADRRATQQLSPAPSKLPAAVEEGPLGPNAGKPSNLPLSSTAEANHSSLDTDEFSGQDAFVRKQQTEQQTALDEQTPKVPARSSMGVLTVDEKIDSVARNLLSLNQRVESLQDQLSALERSQQIVAASVDKLVVLMNEARAKEVAPSPAKRAATPAAAPSAQRAQQATGERRSKPTPKAAALAGLWVKGAYPTTGGPTTVAWVMNGENQLEATVRVGSVVRGARVTGFDGMKVITTAGVIQPR